MKTNPDVLGCFWIPPHYHKLTSSGVDANTVKPYTANTTDLQFRQNFQNHVLPQLRSKATPYQDGRKFMRKSKTYGVGFSDIVNDALRQIYKGHKSYVLTQDQVVEVLKFVPDINVSYSDGIYFVWK